MARASADGTDDAEFPASTDTSVARTILQLGIAFPEEEEDVNNNICNCRSAIVANGNSKRMLFAVSIGLLDNEERPLSIHNLSFEPYKSSG